VYMSKRLRVVLVAGCCRDAQMQRRLRGLSVSGETQRVVGQQEEAAVGKATASSPWLPTAPCTGARFIETVQRTLEKTIERTRFIAYTTHRYRQVMIGAALTLQR